MEMVPMVLDMGLRIGGRWYATGSSVEMPKRDADDYVALNYAHVDREALVKKLEAENRQKKVVEERQAAEERAAAARAAEAEEKLAKPAENVQVRPQIVTKQKPAEGRGYRGRR